MPPIMQGPGYGVIAEPRRNPFPRRRPPGLGFPGPVFGPLPPGSLMPPEPIPAPRPGPGWRDRVLPPVHGFPSPPGGFPGRQPLPVGPIVGGHPFPIGPIRRIPGGDVRTVLPGIPVPDPGATYAPGIPYPGPIGGERMPMPLPFPRQPIPGNFAEPAIPRQYQPLLHPQLQARLLQALGNAIMQRRVRGALRGAHL